MENYFELNNQWYEGPKKYLKWFKENDNITFELYSKVLSEGVASESIKILVDQLSGINKS